MELVVKISFYSDSWVFFAKSRFEEMAKEKAFEMFKQNHSDQCLFETLEEALKDNNFSIEVKGTVIC